jgi:hypothetical protein
MTQQNPPCRQKVVLQKEKGRRDQRRPFKPDPRLSPASGQTPKPILRVGTFLGQGGSMYHFYRGPVPLNRFMRGLLRRC